MGKTKRKDYLQFCEVVSLQNQLRH